MPDPLHYLQLLKYSVKHQRTKLNYNTTEIMEGTDYLVLLIKSTTWQKAECFCPTKHVQELQNLFKSTFQDMSEFQLLKITYNKFLNVFFSLESSLVLKFCITSKINCMIATFKILIMLELVKNFHFPLIRMLSIYQFLQKSNQDFCVSAKHFCLFLTGIF